MARIRILVADGHRIFAEALAAALAAEPDVDVAAAGSAQAAERALDRAAAENRPFHVLLADADLTPGHPAPGQLTPGAPAPATPPPATPLPGTAGPAPGSHPAPSRATSTPAPRQPLPGAPAGSDPRPALAPPQRAPLALPAQRTPSAPPTARIPAPRTPDARTPVPAAAPAPAPPGDGIALGARARAAHPGLQAIVISADDDPRRVVHALQSGAAGWVAKESSLGRLMGVVRGVLRDETHIPPLLLTGVVRELTAARRDRTESELLVESLTPRERQVLRCMVAGLGRQAVADRLYLSPHTVRTHMQNVLGKLGVHSTLAAVAVARRAGVGPSD